MKHMQDHLEEYLHGKFNAGERHILITHWVGDAWEELSKRENSRSVGFLLQQMVPKTSKII